MSTNRISRYWQPQQSRRLPPPSSPAFVACPVSLLPLGDAALALYRAAIEQARAEVEQTVETVYPGYEWN